MKKETRVYVLDLLDFEEPDMEMNPQSEYFREQAFVNTAEKYGSVYSLAGFQKAINEQELNLNECYILFKETEYQE